MVFKETKLSRQQIILRKNKFLLFIMLMSFWYSALIEASITKDLSLDKIPFMTGATEYNYDVDLKGWNVMADKLKDCRASSFNLPNPIQITFIKMAINFGGSKKLDGQPYTQNDIDKLIENTYQDYIIHGWQKNNCIVTIKAKPYPKEFISGYSLNEDFIKQMFPITQVKCVFSKDELKVLYLSAMQMGNESRDTKIDEKAGEILARTCRSN